MKLTHTPATDKEEEEEEKAVVIEMREVLQEPITLKIAKSQYLKTIIKATPDF